MPAEGRNLAAALVSERIIRPATTRRSYAGSVSAIEARSPPCRGASGVGPAWRAAHRAVSAELQRQGQTPLQNDRGAAARRLRRRVEAGAAADGWRGRLRAADRLRQRGESVVGARGHAAAGDGRAAGPGRGTRAVGAAVVDRERLAGSRRGRGGFVAGDVGGAVVVALCAR